MKRKDLEVGMLVAVENHQGVDYYAEPAMVVGFGWRVTTWGNKPIQDGNGVAVAVREERIQNGKQVFFWHPSVIMLQQILAPWGEYQDTTLAGAINKVRLLGEEV